MPYSTSKPLPNIPEISHIHGLCVESDALMATLLQQAITEEKLESHWFESIRKALCDFGRYIESKETLYLGIRLRRKESRVARSEQPPPGPTPQRNLPWEQDTKIKEKAINAHSKVIELDFITNRSPPGSKIEEIRNRIVKQTPTETSSQMHLVVAVSTSNDWPSAPGTAQHDYSMIQFQEETFHQNREKSNNGVIIYGLDNWQSGLLSANIVGGTFVVTGISSKPLFDTLICILRLSLYVYLSLLLEQGLLQNFHIALQYPSSTPPSSCPPRDVPTELPRVREEPTSSVRHPKSTFRKSGSSLWSYISRKTENLVHRVAGSSYSPMEETRMVGDVVPGSIDSREVTSSKRDQTMNLDERFDQEVGSSSHNLSETTDVTEREYVGAFTTSIQRIINSRCILSTSLRVHFPPPLLLVQLASREQGQESFKIETSVDSSISSSILSTATTVKDSIKLTGVEKTGLASIIGWENREARGKGMCGTKGFIRQQGITILYHKRRRTEIGSVVCGKHLCTTYRYYSRISSNDSDPDSSLGEFIESICDKESLSRRCSMEGCEGLLQDHIHSWTCDSVIIEGILNKKEDSYVTVGEGEDIIMWQSCFVCKQETTPYKMDAKTYLFSFAKFLEILVWSPMIRSLSLCSHVPDDNLWKHSGQIDARDVPYNVIYHFLYNGYTLSLSLRSIHANIFELQLPRLQLVSASSLKEVRISAKNECNQEEKETLRTQIEHWWRGIYMRIDRLDDFLAKSTETNKDLPPLPSSDDEGGEDEDEDGGEETNNEGASASFSSSTVGPPSSRPAPAASQASFSSIASFSSGYALWNNLKNFGKTVPYPPSLPFRAIESRTLLAKLKESFQKSEALLKDQLDEASPSSLNDVRRNFQYNAQGTAKRLSAWQKKHVPGAPKNLSNGHCTTRKPEWWNNSCHAVPGGSVLVREGESGSMIAFTLSSLEYQRELANPSPPLGHPTSKQQSNPEFLSGRGVFSPDTSDKPLGSSTPLPDPDVDDTMLWSQPEACISTVTRCEHPREESLLGLRDVLRITNSSNSSSSDSRFTGSISRGASVLMPPSAWAQPQVQVSLSAADGELTQLGHKGLIEKNSQSSYATSSPGLQDYKEHGSTARPSMLNSMKVQDGTHEILSLAASQPVSITPHRHVPTFGGSTPIQSSSLTETLTNAMRYLLTSEPKTPSRAPSPVPSSTLHGLLAHGSLYSVNDEQPHIRYDCTIGNKMKFRCTVYYAKQFDMIRKRCGVDSDIVKSLQRSENWLAVGGKSKSNFWRSLDGRFIIKTLVNAWNVADLQVLIDLAPSYFRYIESTAAKASTLAKLMGFYTVEVKNMETGVVQMKHDVLVMENLFYGREISRIYDLKGIVSRRVKAKGESRDKTFYDSEWIEAQQQGPLLLHGHSGHILREGLRADAEFLAKSNITDYSLLLGVDEDNRQISCGLVDTIGSYTFAKTLEYKAKHNLITTKGKETTVIPPTEYQRRFLIALENYFLICPDKWTKPHDYIDRTSPHDLPDVL